MDANKVGMILITILQIPSLYCAIHIFSRFSQRRSSLRRLENHLLIYLLIIATWTISIDLLNTQIYLWSGSVAIQTSWFCFFWNTSFFSTATLNRLLMAFMSIERHFLVFRPQFYRTRRSRLQFHYIPLIIITSITLIYMLIINIIVSCSQRHFNYSRFMCGYTCSVLLHSLVITYAWMYVIIPTTITIIGCILLPIRFVTQKRQLQRVQWHHARKMIVQMSVIAGTYTICWLPYAILLQLLLNDLLSTSDPNISRFLVFVPYMTSLLTPFIVFHAIRGQIRLALVEQIKRRFFPQRQGMIRPIITVAAQQLNHLEFEEHDPTAQ